LIEDRRDSTNKKKPLPRHYIEIERMVCHNGDKSSLLEVVMKEGNLILLADAPGTGKSSALTRLES